MIRIGIKEYPRAYQAARAISTHFAASFPLNVSQLLENIRTHKIYDISSKTYNSSFAKDKNEMVSPKKAWTIFNPQLDVYLIVWNAFESPSSIRYSVAHEIGHIILNHERSWPTDIALKKRQKETEANVFANCLLAPLDVMHRLCEQKPFSARLVSTYFGIPYAVAKKMQYDYEYWVLLQE